VLEPLGEIDGCCIVRRQSLPVVEADCDSTVSKPTVIQSLPNFNLDNIVVESEENTEKSEERSEHLCEDIEKKIIPCENETTNDISDTVTFLPVAESTASSSPDIVSTCFEFKKPSSSPPGSRKRLPVATVTQLHKDSLGDENDVSCLYCSCQVLSKVEADLANISNISVQSDQAHGNISHLSACSDLSIVSHNDSGYQTFNSTALSMTANSQHLSLASSIDTASIFPKPDIPLPPLPVTTEVKKLTFEEVLEKHSPSYRTFSNSMIGRKIGVEAVDIISELYYKGASTCLRIVLGLLEVKDLKCMCLVSQTWKRVCLEDTRIRQRLKEDKAKARDKTLSLGKV
jgi:hypothetical protein